MVRSEQPRRASGERSRLSPEGGGIRARRPRPVSTRLVCAGLATRRACTSTPSIAATATTTVTSSRGSPKRSSLRTCREGRSCSWASCSACLEACTALPRAVRSPAGIRTASVRVVTSGVSRLAPTAHARGALRPGKEARCCTSGSRKTCVALTRSTGLGPSCAPPACCRTGAATTSPTTGRSETCSQGRIRLGSAV